MEFLVQTGIGGILTPAGSLFGLTVGAVWIASRGGYRASGPIEERALRCWLDWDHYLVVWTWSNLSAR
jgi:hypothetical protein